MAITEERRHRLYTALEGVIGAEDASTMMESLPPVGWGDVATRRDLDNLGGSTRHEIEHQADLSRQQIASLGDRLRTEWSRQAVAMVISIVTANTAMTALIVSVAKISG